MKHMGEFAPCSTTVWASFGAPAIFGEPLDKARFTVVFPTADGQVGIAIGLCTDLTDEACRDFFHKVEIETTTAG